MIETIISTLSQCPLEEILVVLGHRAEEIRSVLAPYPVRIVYNAQYQRGMLSSVQAGIMQTTGSPDAHLICLGDQPSLQRRTIQRLIDAFKGTKPGIYVPCYRGQSGHPLLVSAHYRDEIKTLDPAIGLRELLQRHPDAIQRVEVNAPEVLEDLDIPEDYRRLRRLVAHNELIR